MPVLHCQDLCDEPLSIQQCPEKGASESTAGLMLRYGFDKALFFTLSGGSLELSPWSCYRCHVECDSGLLVQGKVSRLAPQMMLQGYTSLPIFSLYTSIFPRTYKICQNNDQTETVVCLRCFSGKGLHNRQAISWFLLRGNSRRKVDFGPKTCPSIRRTSYCGGREIVEGNEAQLSHRYLPPLAVSSRPKRAKPQAWRIWNSFSMTQARIFRLSNVTRYY